MKRVGLAHRESLAHIILLTLTLLHPSRYLLATCSFTPLYGRLCNVLGRKRANHTALFFSGLGVLMCGLSTNMEMLIVARFVRLYYFSLENHNILNFIQLSGIGGGGLLTTSSYASNASKFTMETYNSS